MRISSNADMLNSLYTLSRNNAARQSAFKRLSTGKRINTGADDPAGLIAASYLSSHIESNSAALRTEARNQALANTAEGAMGAISGMVTQVKALQLANSGNTISTSERAANQLQMDSLLSAIDRVSNGTTFMGRQLLNGSATIQSGPTAQTIPSMNTAHLGTTSDGTNTYTLSDLRTGGRLTGTANAQLASQVVSQAGKDVSTARGSLGALQNQIDSTVSSIVNASINLSAARSTIEDTDYATEFTNLMQQSVAFKANLIALKKTHETTGAVLSLFG